MSNEDNTIAEINSLMAMEGMSLTTENKNRLRCLLSNPDDLEKIINDLEKTHCTSMLILNYSHHCLIIASTPEKHWIK